MRTVAIVIGTLIGTAVLGLAAGFIALVGLGVTTALREKGA